MARRGTLTPLGVFHFSTVVLFFSNSLFVADATKGIIENTQNEIQNYYCDNLRLYHSVVNFSHSLNKPTANHQRTKMPIKSMRLIILVINRLFMKVLWLQGMILKAKKLGLLLKTLALLTLMMNFILLPIRLFKSQKKILRFFQPLKGLKQVAWKTLSLEKN